MTSHERAALSVLACLVGSWLLARVAFGVGWRAYAAVLVAAERRRNLNLFWRPAMTTTTDAGAALAGTLDMLRTALAVAGLRGDRGTAERLARLIAEHADPTPDVCVDVRCEGIRRAAAYLTSCGEAPAGWSFTADGDDLSAPADRADLEA